MSSAIQDKKFSTHFEGQNGNSFIDFGSPVESSTSGLADAVALNVKDEFYWQVEPQGIRYGQPEDNLEFHFGSDQSMLLTTATAFSFVPRSLATDFFFNLFHKYQLDYSVESGMFVVDCNLKFPPVHFLVQDYWVTLNGEDLLMDISPNQDRSLCVCSFLPATDEIWVLGQSIYMNYYMVHDPDNKQISFAPTEKRLKDPLEPGVKPQFVLQKAFSLIFLGFKFGGMILAGVFTYLITLCIDSNKATTFLDATSRAAYEQKQ